MELLTLFTKFITVLAILVFILSGVVVLGIIAMILRVFKF